MIRKGRFVDFLCLFLNIISCQILREIVIQMPISKSLFKEIFLVSLFSISFSCASIYGKDENTHLEYTNETKQEAPPNIGNFALPSSQQPGPLISFGENIIDKGQIQTFLFADKFKGVRKQAVDIIPSILFGITDDLSVFFNVPIAASYKDDEKHSSGLEDMFLQLEQAFYTQKTADFVDQATFVGNVTLPTGSTKKQPPTGFGAPSIFLGGTFNRTYTDWFGFTSHGAVLTTSHNSTKFGNEFLYQCGVGRNILNIDSKWTLAWMIEADGQFSQKDKINGMTNPNSGGNTVYITPSLWISSKSLIVQVGFGLPATQHLFGNQKKNKYLLAINFGRTF